MGATDEAIERLAEAFCKLSGPEHLQLYRESLQSIARIAQSELIYRMELGFSQAHQAMTNH
jgi:hypothetical protein